MAKKREFTRELPVAVTDQDIDEIIIPYVKVRFSRGMKISVIYIGILISIIAVLVCFSGEDHLRELLLYGYGFDILLFFVCEIPVFIRVLNLQQKRKNLYIQEVEFVEFTTTIKKLRAINISI